MRRRSILRSVGAALALGSVDTVAAHPTATSTATADSRTPSSDPLGAVAIEQAREAVVADDGTTAYVANNDGFVAVDVADPTAPEIVYEGAVLPDHEDGPLQNIWDVHVDGDRLLVVGPAHPVESDLAAAVTFDVSDPAAPVRVSAHEIDSPIHNAVLVDGVGYLVANGLDGNPLVTIDAATGERLGRWSLTGEDDRWSDVHPAVWPLHDVWVDREYAYLAYWDAGTWILDVSDPTAPAFVSRVRGRSVEDLVDVEEPLQEAITLPGNDHFVTVDESGDLLGIGVEAWAADEDSDAGPGGIMFFDISDRTAPEELGSIAPPPTPDPTRSGVWTTSHNFDLVDGRCYSSWYRGGVKIHDVSDPTDPVELYSWRDTDSTQFWTAQLAVPGEFFVASSMAGYGKNEERETETGTETEPGTETETGAGTETDAETEPDAEWPGDGLYTFPDGERSLATETPTPSPTDNSEAESGGDNQMGTARGTGDGLLSTGLLGLLGLGALTARRSHDD